MSIETPNVSRETLEVCELQLAENVSEAYMLIFIFISNVSRETLAMKEETNMAHVNFIIGATEAALVTVTTITPERENHSCHPGWLPATGLSGRVRSSFYVGITLIIVSQK